MWFKFVVVVAARTAGWCVKRGTPNVRHDRVAARFALGPMLLAQANALRALRCSCRSARRSKRRVGAATGCRLWLRATPARRVWRLGRGRSTGVPLARHLARQIDARVAAAGGAVRADLGGILEQLKIVRGRSM